MVSLKKLYINIYLSHVTVALLAPHGAPDIAFSVLSTSIDVNELQSENALPDILVTLFGIIIDVNDVQPSNAS